MSEAENDPPPFADRPSVAPPGFAAQRGRKRDLLAEQRSGWAEGDPEPPEAFLPQWPGDARADSDFASLLIEDMLQRRARGEDVRSDDYSQRFPEHHDSLDRLLSRQAMLRSLGGSGSERCLLRMPAAGDELFHFRLRRELGRGAFARVFLAEQADLAGRPVALKVSAIEGSEPQTLAQLQHTHIVPIYSVHEDARAGLRAVCMPFFGGASLSQVLEKIRESGHTPQQGTELLRALQAAQGPLDAPSPETGTPCPARAVIANLSYAGAVAWVIARLAEGLQHAHQRGVLHRDVKPSNVLLGIDGQPMLLDFNLSQDQHTDPAEAMLGGTVAYMSPEHLRALSGRNLALYRQVDQRSDIYSLGMVLFESLAGQSPFDHSGSYSLQPLRVEAMAAERSKAAPSLRQRLPDVSWNLESIVGKCLAPNPAERYQQAEHLAEDLRRFLDDRPLRFAPELSWAERARKWMRRHPRLTSAGAVAAVAVVLLALGGLVLAATRIRLADTEAELTTSRAEEFKILGYVQIQAGRKAEAIDSFTRALELDSGLADAHYNRGLVRLELNQHDQALNDFDRALQLGKADPPVYAARGMALECLGQHSEADEAFRTAFAGIDSVSVPDRVRMRCVYAFAVSRRIPNEARRAFEAALRDDPENARALYGLAMLAAPDDAAEALQFLVRALKTEPNFVEARRYCAVLRARLGELERASQEIAACLEKEQFSGDSVYAAACVIALAAEQRSDAHLRDQAVDLLEKAHARGVGLEKATRDPDLAGLRNHPGFQHLLGRVNGHGELKGQTHVNDDE